jgi:hypothetical protein
VVNATPRPVYPRERPDTHCIGGCVGPRTGLDVCGKSRPPPGFDPRIVQSVASRPTALSRPSILKTWGKENCSTFVDGAGNTYVRAFRKNLLNRAEPSYCLRKHVNRLLYDAVLSGRQVLTLRKKKEALSSSARGQRCCCRQL